MLTFLPGWPVCAAEPNASPALQRLAAAVAVVCAMMLWAPSAHATAITDPQGYVLEDTFKGPHNGDLDVASARAAPKPSALPLLIAGLGFLALLFRE